jgi:hypothetical protein
MSNPSVSQVDGLKLSLMEKMAPFSSPLLVRTSIRSILHKLTTPCRGGYPEIDFSVDLADMSLLHYL